MSLTLYIGKPFTYPSLSAFYILVSFLLNMSSDGLISGQIPKRLASRLSLTRPSFRPVGLTARREEQVFDVGIKNNSGVT